MKVKRKSRIEVYIVDSEMGILEFDNLKRNQKNAVERRFKMFDIKFEESYTIKDGEYESGWYEFDVESLIDPWVFLLFSTLQGEC